MWPRALDTAGPPIQAPDPPIPSPSPTAKPESVIWGHLCLALDQTATQNRTAHSAHRATRPAAAASALDTSSPAAKPLGTAPDQPSPCPGSPSSSRHPYSHLCKAFPALPSVEAILPLGHLLVCLPDEITVCLASVSVPGAWKRASNSHEAGAPSAADCRAHGWMLWRERARGLHSNPPFSGASELP